jgi:8-oxo-dGTP pyrophosphatase MutT (NUDIX family)
VSEPAWFRTEDRRHVYRGFSTVRVDRVRMPDGTQADREIVERPDAVAVVPVTDDGRVLLLRHYRQPFERYLLELPAGLLDKEGEEVEAAAHRELAEELQHDARQLRHLATVHNSAGWSDESTHLYLGTEVVPVPAPEGFVATGEEADIEVVSMDVGDAVRIAREGGIPDAKTALGLLLAAAHLGV